MSTRATITVKQPEGGYLSYYKHHDGYISGGLGEALMHYVSYSDPVLCKFTREDFVDYVEKTECVNPYFFDQDVELIEGDIELWASEQYKVHGDTEYHYSVEIGKGNKYYLFVQERDYTDGAQNGTDQTKTGHWTDFAKKQLIGTTTLFMKNKLR